MPTYRCHDFSLAEAKLHLSNTNNVDVSEHELESMKERCMLASGEVNAGWFDRDGVRLVQYFPHIISSELQTRLCSELCNLMTVCPPYPPPTDEHHRSGDYEAQRASLPDDTPCGLLSFGFLHMQGHENECPQPSGTWFGSDVSCAKSLAGLHFRQSTTVNDLSEFVSILFAATDPESWRKYRDAYLRFVNDHVPLLKAIDTNGMQCFLTYCVLVNMSTGIHRDLKDPPDGWVAMVVFGEYTDGRLCLPDINVALPYRSGDVVFLRSWALKHFIWPFVGTRYVFVSTTSESIVRWLQESSQ
jgi:hypothetical protein